MKKTLIWIVILLFIFSGCASDKNDLAPTAQEVDALKIHLSEVEAELKSKTLPQIDQPLLVAATQVMSHLKNKDFEQLSQWIHPTYGVMLKPYPSIDAGMTQTFNSESLLQSVQSTTPLIWGIYDGSGEPITLNFMAFFDEFVYDADFLTPETIAVNHTISSGNASTDFKTVYPNASYVEFHFSGFDPQFEGIDWKSLFLVFEQVNGKWYLIAIEHNEWTI